ESVLYPDTPEQELINAFGSREALDDFISVLNTYFGSQVPNLLDLLTYKRLSIKDLKKLNGNIIADYEVFTKDVGSILSQEGSFFDENEEAFLDKLFLLSRLDIFLELPQEILQEFISYYSRFGSRRLNTQLRELWDFCDVRELRPSFIHPEAQNYSFFRKQEQDRRGQYTINPETFGLNFEEHKIIIPDLGYLEGKPIYEMLYEVVERYGEDHYIPGIELLYWLKKQNKFPLMMDPANYYKSLYVCGSLICDKNGYWRIINIRPHPTLPPTIGQNWLGNPWEKSGRILLLKK